MVDTNSEREYSLVNMTQFRVQWNHDKLIEAYGTQEG